jgi:hypothetical protein
MLLSRPLHWAAPGRVTGSYSAPAQKSSAPVYAADWRAGKYSATVLASRCPTSVRSAVSSEPRDVVFGAIGTLEETGAVLSAALGVVFELHDSLYMGGDYYLAHLEGGGEVRIRPNVDLIDELPEVVGWAGPVFVEVVASDSQVVARRVTEAGLTPISRNG